MKRKKREKKTLWIIASLAAVFASLGNLFYIPCIGRTRAEPPEIVIIIE